VIIYLYVVLCYAVLDDEDNSITANAIVTVMVTLTRESMLSKYGSDPGSLANAADWAAAEGMLSLFILHSEYIECSMHDM